MIRCPCFSSSLTTLIKKRSKTCRLVGIRTLRTTKARLVTRGTNSTERVPRNTNSELRCGGEIYGCYARLDVF